ncbi:MAG: GIY-YIG nuclease family protein [Lentimicrobium sp.]|nr:GIY-YIG nuclease family protein [Lentimicrobium sp.]
MKKGYMYILQCSNGAYYTGSTIDLDKRLAQHQAGEGANFTKKHLPVSLVYYEEFQRIDDAFYREKQVQGWSRAKKEALIKGETNLLNELSKCQNETHFRNYKRKDGVSASLNAQSSICYINSVNYKKSNGLLIFDLETSVTCV